MVKLTFENISVKLGKPVDPKSLTSLVLKNAQIDELGTFEKFVLLEEVDLSSNRLCFQRQLTGLFGAKSTVTNVNLSGNPVCASANYRVFMIYNLPLLEVLDGVEVTATERELAQRVIGRGEVISQATSSREGLEEEAAEIAQLNEAASKTRVDPARKREDLLLKQQREYEEEKAEAARIALLLGHDAAAAAVADEPVEPVESEKEKKARLEKEKKEAEKRLKAEKAEAEAKARAEKAEAEAKKKADAKAKAEADAKAKAEAKIAKTPAATVPVTTSSAGTNAISTTTTSKVEKKEPIATEETPQREAVGLKFQDSRSGLSISTSLSDSETVRAEPIVPVVSVPKRQFATEESIFGTQTSHKPLDLDSLPPSGSSKPSSSLFGEDDDDDLFSKATKAIDKSSAKRTATTGSRPQVDSDDLFAMLDSKRAPTKKAASAQASDDLFAMLDAPKPAKQTTAKKSSIDSGHFDIDSFITTTKSSGGLFDD